MANPVQINDSLFTAGLVLSAQDARTGLSSLVAHDGAGVCLGVFYEGKQTLLTGTATTSPSMQVQVAQVAFCGSKAAAEGVYIGRSPGAVPVDIAAAPASNSRIDVVYVMQRDSNALTSPDGVTQGELGVVTGTAALSPTKPAIPAGAVEVGTVTVAAGATKTTDAQVTLATTAKWTVAAGSPIPVANQAARDALTGYEGLRVTRLDAGGVIDTHDGTAWRSGVWQDFTPTLYGSMGTTPVGIGTNVAFARYRYLDPHTVQAQVDCSRQAGTTITDGFGISLPVPAARRYVFSCGTLHVAGSSAPAGQSRLAYMSGDATKLILVDDANNYLNMPASLAVRYFVTYEV